MESKSLIYGISGFLLGGLLVSVAATAMNKPETKSTSQDMTMSEMTESLKNKTGDDYDLAFIENMTMHHQSAVDMAKLSEGRAKHDEIKQLSTDIINAQEKEITQMQQWQKDWGYMSDMMPMEHSSH